MALFHLNGEGLDNLQLAQSFNGKSAPLPVHEPGLFAERRRMASALGTRRRGMVRGLHGDNRLFQSDGCV